MQSESPQGQRWRHGRPIASRTTTSQSGGGSCHQPPTGGPLCSTRLGRSGLAPGVSSELWRNGSRLVQLREAGCPLVSTCRGVRGGRGACQWYWRCRWLRPSAAVQQGTTHPCEQPMCGLCLLGGSVIAAVMPCDRPGRSYALSQGSAQLEYYLTPASLFHIGHAR